MAAPSKAAAKPAPAPAPAAKAPAAKAAPAAPGGAASVQQTAGNTAAARAAGASAVVSNDVVDLKDKPEFQPTDAIAQALAANKKGGSVLVRFGDYAAPQPVWIRREHDKYRTGGPDQKLAISHPGLGALNDKSPKLAVTITDDVVTGRLEIAGSGKLEDAIAAHPELVGLAGLDRVKHKVKNVLKDGKLEAGLDDAGFELSFLSGSLTYLVTGDGVEFSGSGKIVAGGLGEGSAVFHRDPAGVITATGDATVSVKNATGTVHVVYAGGVLTGRGKGRFTTEKVDGEITIVVDEKEKANELARSQIDPESLLDDAPAEGKPKAPASKKRAIAGWGELDFTFNEWLTGKVKVIVDADGHFTVVGDIAPPKIVTLLRPHPYNTTFLVLPFNLRYGLPYVADIHVGIKITLGAEATVGPATLSEMEVKGTYSTDPKILNDFSLSGTFRFSASAALTLGFEGHAGLGILGHDIEAGVGITGRAGIHGYAEAKPTLGYREKADPAAGKKGEFYIQGHLELAAQPFLGLDGDFHIHLDSPWWSPAPTKTWTWPIGSLEYPLPGSFGIGADVDYVIGSDKWPEISWGKADFDRSKFTDALTSSDDGSGMQKRSGKADQQKEGKWIPAPTPPAPVQTPPTPPKSAAPPGKSGIKATSAAAGKKSGRGQQSPAERASVPESPEVAYRWNEGMKALAALHNRAEKAPEDDEHIHHDLARLQHEFGFKTLEPRLEGDYWVVDADMNPKAKPAKPKIKASKQAKAKPAAAAKKAAAAKTAPAPTVTTAVQHQAGNKQVVVNSGSRWHLPASTPSSRIPPADVLGDRMQAAATAARARWSRALLSPAEASAIAAAHARGEHYLGPILEGQARGRYVESEMRKWARLNAPTLKWSRTGVDAVDPATGIAYEILSGTPYNTSLHARRMPGVFYRMITF
jgi:hypothetical protein